MRGRHLQKEVYFFILDEIARMLYEVLEVAKFPMNDFNILFCVFVSHLFQLIDYGTEWESRFLYARSTFLLREVDIYLRLGRKIRHVRTRSTKIEDDDDALSVFSSGFSSHERKTINEN